MEYEKCTPVLLPPCPPVLHSFIWINLCLSLLWTVNAQCRLKVLLEGFSFLLGISLNLKEATVYLELVEPVCLWSHTLLASPRPESISPGELSQLSNNSLWNSWQVSACPSQSLRSYTASRTFQLHIIKSPQGLGRGWGTPALSCPQAFLGLGITGWLSLQWSVEAFLDSRTYVIPRTTKVTPLHPPQVQMRVQTTGLHYVNWRLEMLKHSRTCHQPRFCLTGGPHL